MFGSCARAAEFARSPAMDSITANVMVADASLTIIDDERSAVSAIPGSSAVADDDSISCGGGCPSHRPDFDHVGYEMPQQILDAVLQRRGR
jgi:hypothetical protein